MKSGRKPILAAMIALEPLPGSPLYQGDPDAIVSKALEDLATYKAAGVDAIVIENSLDLPFIKPPLDPRALELVEHVARKVRAAFNGQVGLQLLEAANLEALEIAHRAKLDFIRVEGYVFAHVGGAGIIEGCAGQLHRRRKELGCEQVKLIADIKKKHCAHALTGDLTIADVARQAEFFLADGIIVTGSRTGQEPQIEDLDAVRAAVQLPVWIGSGMTPSNIRCYTPKADAFIVGSTFREGGDYRKHLDPARLDSFMVEWQKSLSAISQEQHQEPS